MKSLKLQSMWVALAAAAALSAAWMSAASAAGADAPLRLSVLGGVHTLNQNDTAFPDNFVNVPVVASLGYDLHPNWALEGEFGWLIPVLRSVDVGSGSSQDLKTPDILLYQASVVGKLPLAQSPWTPYIAAGAGAVTFLSNRDADRFPQLSKSQTAFALNFGAGTTYDLGSRWGLRADYRELVAFPSKDAEGLSDGSSADPLWMERGTLGLSYRF
jgi:opacity protein-like surface antigen